MKLKIVVEIIANENYRWLYSSKENVFKVKEFNHRIINERAIKGIYGWVVGYGKPPKNHLDVVLLTKNNLKLGQVTTGILIGVFKRSDGDHKLICVEESRKENTLAELPKEDMDSLYRLYDENSYGDEWLSREFAIEIIKNHDTENKIRY